jgi:hypothetical protein
MACGDDDPYVRRNDLHHAVLRERAARKGDQDTGQLDPFVPAYHLRSAAVLGAFLREVLREAPEGGLARGTPVVIWEEIGRHTVRREGRRSLVGRCELDAWRRATAAGGGR